MIKGWNLNHHTLAGSSLPEVRNLLGEMVLKLCISEAMWPKVRESIPVVATECMHKLKCLHDFIVHYGLQGDVYYP